MDLASDAAAEWSRSYYVPDPPRIPLPPGANETTAPAEEPGWTGPRFYTLLRGDDWNDPEVGIPSVVPYTFATRAMSRYSTGEGDPAEPGFSGTSGEPLDAVQRASIRQALSAWEQVSGLTFVEVSDPDAWAFDGVRFLLESIDVYELLGRTYANGDPYGFNIAFNRLEYPEATLQPGTLGYWTALHEIGHAIGLKHPFDGDPALKVSEDTNKNTVMSYTDKGNLSGLGPFDVAAVQHIYGSPAAKAASALRWSQGPNGSVVTTGNDDANVIGGHSFRDIVQAGGGNDLIRVLGGDDYVAPGGGDDAVFGGAGADVLNTGSLRRGASVEGLGVGDEGVQGTVVLGDGKDTFYGVETIHFIDGDLAVAAESAAGRAYRLYGAALDRDPDALGLSYWTAALQSGAITLSDAASTFVASPEFAARYGAPNDADYVAKLYRNVLDRAPDADGLAHWVNTIRELGAGGRASVLVSFSESAENQTKTAGAYAQGLWVQDAESIDVARAYVGVLDRAPDAGGLTNWTVARDAGMSQSELVARFVSSPEFQGRFGGLSNRDFADQLYRTSLDRAPSAEEVAYWGWVLDAGIDGRAGVALAFVGSAEMGDKIAQMLADGDLFA